MTPGLQWVSLMLRTRIGWAGRHWALPFLTALVPAARYDRRKGRRHKMVTDYAQQMLVCLRRWLPDRDLVVVCDGGYAKRQRVKAHRRRNQTAPRRVPVPARATMAARPDWAPPGGRSATAQPMDDPATQWTPYRATGSDGSSAMVELTSGVAHHGGPLRLPIRWVVSSLLYPSSMTKPAPPSPTPLPWSDDTSCSRELLCRPGASTNR